MQKLILFFRKNLFAAFLVFLIACIAASPQPSIAAAGAAITAWLEIILPSLLPFSIAASMLIATGIIDQLSRRVEKITRKIFGFSGNFLYVFLCSALSGYPMGAKLCAEAVKKGTLRSCEASFMVNATSTSGPLFIAGSVACGMLNNPSLCAPLLLAHYLAALATALLAGRVFHSQNLRCAAHPCGRFIREPLGKILFSSAYGSMNSMLTICAFMVFFSVVSSVIEHILPLCTLYSTLLAGAFELSTGCLSASGLAFPLSAVLVSFFTGFGGLSVICQMTAIAAEGNVKTHGLFLCKLFQGCLSALFAYLFLAPIDAGILIAFAGICVVIGLLCVFSLKKANKNAS